MAKRLLALFVTTIFMATSLSAQDDVQFPFPQIPEQLQTPEARLGYLMEHYWSRYDFSDTSERNQAVAEQGFADYVNLMQYADSATCALSARVLADSISRSQSRGLCVAVDDALGAVVGRARHLDRVAVVADKHEGAHAEITGLAVEGTVGRQRVQCDGVGRVGGKVFNGRGGLVLAGTQQKNGNQRDKRENTGLQHVKQVYFCRKITHFRRNTRFSDEKDANTARYIK